MNDRSQQASSFAEVIPNYIDTAFGQFLCTASSVFCSISTMFGSASHTAVKLASSVPLHAEISAVYIPVLVLASTPSSLASKSFSATKQQTIRRI